MTTRRDFLKTSVSLAAASLLPRHLLSQSTQEAPLPPLAPKPYRIGVAPSHITLSPDELFVPGADWQKVAARIDFYKFYSLQLAPPPWATRLTPKPFADFLRAHRIRAASEFGGFTPANDWAATAIAEHKPLLDAGGRLDAIHLDGPVARTIRGLNKTPDALSLDQVCARLAEFWSRLRAAWPHIEIGWITNFPNWDYTKRMPGVLGGFTDSTGLTFDAVADAVHDSLAKAGHHIDFLEIDCPFNYYRLARTHNNDAPVDEPAKLLALQRWCRDRKIRCHLIVNCEVGQPTGAKLDPIAQAAADKTFHDGTLDYLRRLRADSVFPDVFVIQSWYVAPKRPLPQFQQHTFMNTARESIDLIETLFPRANPTSRPS